VICCHISPPDRECVKIKKRHSYIRRKAGGHLEVIFKYKFGVQEWRMMGNDPSSPSPAHLPQILGKRIWQPHAHHQTAALAHSHSYSHLASLLFSCKHQHTQACVWAYIRHQDPLGWHQTQTHRGMAAVVPHLGRCMFAPMLG